MMPWYNLDCVVELFDHGIQVEIRNEDALEEGSYVRDEVCRAGGPGPNLVNVGNRSND